MSTLKVGTIQDHANSNTAISIDSGGRATFPKAKVPSFHVYMAAQQTIATSTETTILWDSNYFLNDWSVSSGVLTCGSGAAGIYMLMGSARYNDAADFNVGVKLKRNGDVDATHGIGSQYCYSEYYQGLDVHTLFEFAVGDTLKMNLTQASGSNRTTGGNDSGFHTKLVGYRVSA